MVGNQLHSDALRAAAAKWFEEVYDRGVFITDDRLIICRWNRWLVAKTGRSSEETVGRSLFDLFPELVSRGLDSAYRAALLGETRVLSQRFHGSLLPVTSDFYGRGMTEMAQSGRIEPLSDGEAVIGTLTVIEDVTERVLAERELRNQISAAEHARQSAEQASKLKDEFLATLSHEIRTPLNAIIGWTRILQTQPSIRSRAHALEIIERNAMLQARLVDDLLDMTRVISGKLRLRIDTVALADVARAAIDVVAPATSAKDRRRPRSFENRRVRARYSTIGCWNGRRRWFRADPDDPRVRLTESSRTAGHRCHRVCPEDRVKALAAGYQNHLAKPVDSDVLAVAIISLLSLK
jgi:signal transduction histidine kinase